ncbi:putative amidoligase enzyme-domain-containing protein [Hypoxylon rubiginosum]|uniref:Amidoligase enzyme-domain-containing protein n=1 Tax=Hypoxylon rubiginosum TaxID=110542 RepID=A0ACC0D9K6_9PEZI|nr:putative amidoligase enzyme-domain-containing protein [Hypoxylon rubiginosum]
MEKLTFGIELDFAIWLSRFPEEINRDKKGQAAVLDLTPNTMRIRNPDIPPAWYEGEDFITYEILRHVTQQIDNFVNKLPRRGTPAVGPSLAPFQRWTVRTDTSIELDGLFYPEWAGLEWHGLEIRSPAFEATEEAFAEVAAVVEFIRTKFRVTVPPSCGLHVHVGKGPNCFPLDTLKKMAAVCWAGDLLLQTIHPICRRYNRHCSGPRAKSAVAKGWNADGVDHSPRACMERHSSMLKAIQRSRPRREVEKYNFDRTLPREPAMDPFNPELPTDPSAYETAACLEGPLVIWPEVQEVVRGSVSILEGAEQIMCCTTPNDLAKMMSIGSDSRGAYNFTAYSDRARQNADNKRTVEFRQAAGTMDGSWVVHWAKICVGIARFAEEATDAELWGLMYDCHRRDKKPGQYDALDFLLDLGLPQQARAVQWRWQSRIYILESLQPFSDAADTPATMQAALTRMDF